MEEDNRVDNEQDYHFDWNNDGRNNSNNNQELNVNNSQGQSFGSNNINQNNFSHYNNQNRIPSTSGLQNNSGLSSGKKENKKSDEDSSIGSSLKNDKNNKPLSDETKENKKSSDSSKNNDSNNSDNKDNKTKEDSSNNTGDDNKGKGLGIKRRLGNAALGGLKKGANGLNNLGNDGTETENPDDPGNDVKDFGRNATNVAVGTARGLRNIILFIIKFPWIAVIIGIIILVLFMIILFVAASGGIFGGIKFAGWYCDMYSPTKSDNPGEVSSFYGWRIWNGREDDHKGIDLSYETKGAEILATHDGRIIETNYNVDDVSGFPYGVYITIEDPEVTDEETKFRTYYAHMCSLEEERKLEAACLAGKYDRTCDSNCKEIQDEEGNIEYEYTWSCGNSESEFESLINKLKPGATVKKNDVIGYVSDTGYRSASCDFHLHFETLEDNLNDEPDKGFIAQSPNRFFNIENSTLGCDPVLNNGDNAPTYDRIIRWECEKPIMIDDEKDELVDYCDENEPITPKEYRFKGTIGIKNDEGEYIFTEGLGTYVGEVCGYEAKPTYVGTNAQCAAGVHDYYESFLSSQDPETWQKFQSIKGNAIDYWNNNASLGTNGFSTSQEPSAGSIWVSSHSNAKDSNGVPYGHVMTVTKVEGNVVHVYECNGYTSKTCGNYTYTKEELANKKGFKGYINIIEEGEDC